MTHRLLTTLVNRRAACLALGALFALPYARHSRGAAAPLPRGEDPFTLGVASGMPRPDAVVLWTRLAPRPYDPLGGLPNAPIAVRWELALDERFSHLVQAGNTMALPEHGHSVHVEVNGLPSDQRFFYRFIAGTASSRQSSPIGRTRTAPADNAKVARLRLALASCQHYEQGAYAAHRDIARQDLDFVLFVGDYIYESSNPRFLIRAHEGPPPTTLEGYRARHATYKLDPDLRAAHAAHPWILTWDDHEVVNDYAADRAPRDEKEEPGAFLRRRAAAYKAYFEHLPVSPRTAPVGPHMRIHDRYTWGQLAELWTLDNRQFRSLQPCGHGHAGGRVVAACEEWQNPAQTMWGAEQEQWLNQGLAQTQRRWKLIGQGSQISEAMTPALTGRRFMSDGWDGYPVARQRLLQTIRDAKLSDVVALGGDVHRHVAADLRMVAGDSRSPILASELVCTSITSRGLSEATMTLIRDANPDMRHARSDERGYALIDVTHQALNCEFRATPFPAQTEARLNVQARATVVTGQAGVQLG